jgi:acetyl-CoA acetyltransferase
VPEPQRRQATGGIRNGPRSSRPTWPRTTRTGCSPFRELGLPPERTNPNGSGISLGHPIGATGAILVVKALYELRRTGGRYALVTMCIGGGQGIAAVFERA